MKRLLVAFFLIFSLATYSQTFKVSSLIDQTDKLVSIKGIVLDEEVNHEPLAFATITVKETNESTTSNIDGSFSFNLEPGNYTLIYSFIGYKTVAIENVKVGFNETSNYNQLLRALNREMPILVSQLD